jgi:hypothetical protein
MGEVVMAVVLTFVVLTVLAIAAAGWMITGLRRRNRVTRRQPTAAPLPWLASPSTCARLHRRLRDAVHVVRLALPAPTRRRKPPSELRPLAAAADDLEAHAAALDRDLVLAARLRGPAGAQLRARLRDQVAGVERLAARIAAAATAAAPDRPSAQPTAAALADLEHQLDALEAARDEIARLEASVGLPQAAPST